MKKIIWIIVAAFSLAGAVAKPPPGILDQDPFAGLSLKPGKPMHYEPICIDWSDLQELNRLSDPQLEAFLGELSVTPQFPTNALMRRGRMMGGTFFSLQHPEQPPFPGNIHGHPVWKMNGFYLLNDLNYNYDAPQKTVSAKSSTLSSFKMPSISSLGGGGMLSWNAE